MSKRLIKMIRHLLLGMLVLSLLALGCQKVAEQAAETQDEKAISAGISEIGSLNNELSIEELDNLERDLEEVGW